MGLSLSASFSKVVPGCVCSSSIHDCVIAVKPPRWNELGTELKVFSVCRAWASASVAALEP